MKYIIMLNTGRKYFIESENRESAIKDFLNMAAETGIKKADIKSCKKSDIQV